MTQLLSFWNFIGRHKYVITVVAFGLIIGFLDENSLVRRAKYRHEINQLNSEIERYQKEYQKSTELLNELATNPEALEKIAREKYLMKKPNEDVFVFEK
ncbi:MAG: septum formation initiator family protein [Bacteroides sp.]|nr:septum formation initiator family protein [Bacteroides sp.]